jgi:hypothetical protein
MFDMVQKAEQIAPVFLRQMRSRVPPEGHYSRMLVSRPTANYSMPGHKRVYQYLSNHQPGNRIAPSGNRQL